MDVDELVLGLALGFLLAVALVSGVDALCGAAERQWRISRARLAAKRAERDRLWLEHTGLR